MSPGRTHRLNTLFSLKTDSNRSRRWSTTAAWASGKPGSRGHQNRTDGQRHHRVLEGQAPLRTPIWKRARPCPRTFALSRRSYQLSTRSKHSLPLVSQAGRSPCSNWRRKPLRWSSQTDDCQSATTTGGPSPASRPAYRLPPINFSQSSSLHRPERASYQHIWPREATPHTIRHLQHTQPSFDHSAQPSSIHRNPLTLPPINLSQPSALAQVGSTGDRSPPAPPLLPHLRDLNFKEPFPDSSTQVTSVTQQTATVWLEPQLGILVGGVVCLQYMTKTFCGPQSK